VYLRSVCSIATLGRFGRRILCVLIVATVHLDYYTCVDHTLQDTDTAIAKNFESDAWLLFDDENVSVARVEDAQLPSNYVLFYERREVVPL